VQPGVDAVSPFGGVPFNSVLFDSVEAVRAGLAREHYVADEALCVSVFLAVRLARPLFLEGAPGVGKTELAKVMARLAQAELIRLQCYEGLDLNQAAYEWNYRRQLLELQAQPHAAAAAERVDGLYSQRYLLERPLYKAIDPRRTKPAVLLIDELDRADDEFESFLLELLSDYQLTIPELGTIRATQPPLVVITSNRTREVHDALRRRCLYHWLDYPTFQTEVEILTRKLPTVSASLSEQVVGLVQGLRRADLQKAPGVAETLDWALALSHLGCTRVDAATLLHTAGCVLKHQADVDLLKSGLGAELLAKPQTHAR
jgi:MoxR-like ATPase